jgi:hypothetical protein
MNIACEQKILQSDNLFFESFSLIAKHVFKCLLAIVLIIKLIKRRSQLISHLIKDII